MGLGGVGPSDATCLSSTPSARPPAKRAGSSDAACRHGLMWDHTVFHVVASCRANPAMVAPSKRNCRIAQRITRAPKRARGAHTEWFCSMKVAIWQVCSRHIQHRIVSPDPRRDPGPGRVDRHHRHTPVTLSDHPTTWAPNQLVARFTIEHQSIWGASHAHQMEALQTDEQITPITTIKQHRAAGRGETPPEVLDDSGGRSPLIIKDLNLHPQPRPTPTHPHSTRKSRLTKLGRLRGIHLRSGRQHSNTRNARGRALYAFPGVGLLLT